MVEKVVIFVMIAGAGSAISLTTSKAGIFEKPRTWIEKKSEFLGELVHCPYCTSHYVNLILVLLCKPTVLTLMPPIINYIVGWFCLVAISSLISGLVFKSISSMD